MIRYNHQILYYCNNKFALLKDLARFILYGNYFVALCAVALCLETSYQLEAGLNDLLFYFFVFAASVSFYTIAYLGEIAPGNNNRRLRWYRDHKQLVKISHTSLIVVMIVTGSFLLFKNIHNLRYLSLADYFLAAVFPLAGLSYYGIPFLPVIRFS